MPNFDEKTGIRYGVISPQSISSWSMDEIYQNGTDPYYENMKKEINDLVDEMISNTNWAISDDAIAGIKDLIMDDLNEGYENPDGAMDYSDNDYDLHVSGDNFGIFVMRSPYYTYCRDCSPCAPGAGDLDYPIGVFPVNGDLNLTVDKESYEAFLIAGDPRCYRSGKTLCLGPEWFDTEDEQYSRKIPYRVFRVDNDQEVV